ncbi:saccharopine dehydrogenase [Longilinea arvoryzae]|uniref:Saccharopine dehydrogenase n=1 Tax=Longilinea arvoryzae TaxID=360412 RepID=A0A0S7BG58_9CHLR|nr:saccharopine dehydrogenase NADP-binding domain-containing protein [Longilinea arvoryzae]GAP13026.1 saccharopine dehydrogenase [Longilinea arvoryzae]
MAKILILGGYGQTGKPLAHHLLQESQAEIVLGGRSLEKAAALAAQLNAQYPGGRASAVRVDAANAESLRAALQGVDLLVAAAPTMRHAETVARAALEAGADYLDVQLDSGKLAVLRALAPEIERAGRCFITEAGFHPGLPAAMVRYAAARLDRLDTAITAAYLNMGRNLPYSEAVDELMQVFQNYQAQVFKNGAWTKAGSYEMRQVNFGGEIGERRCYSMFFEELRELPHLYPSLREVGFFIAGSDWATDWVITPIVMLGLKLAPKRGIRPMGKLMWWSMQTFSRPPHIVLLKVIANGEKDGRTACVQVALSHPDGYELTAIPVAACLLQWLDGSVRRPGLWMMGHLAEPQRLFADMRRMGVKVEER